MRPTQQYAIRCAAYPRPDGRQILVVGARMINAAVLRRMNATSIRLGYQWPVDPRLLVTLSPKDAMVVTVAGDGFPELPHGQQLVTPVDPDTPLTVGLSLRYPTDSRPKLEQAVGVIAQLRAADFWTLPALNITVDDTVYPDTVAEQAGDALTVFGIPADTVTPYVADCWLVRNGWERRPSVVMQVEQTISGVPPNQPPVFDDTNPERGGR